MAQFIALKWDLNVMSRFYSGKTTPNGGKVEWISQYNSKVARAGNTACKRAIWQNGKVIKETSQKGWLNFEELLQ